MATILDNCIEYLTTLRDEGDDALASMDDGAIQREASRMANSLVNARSAFIYNDLDPTPEQEAKTRHARYIIVLDRYDDDDNCGPDGHKPTTDEEGIIQVARELQEAMERIGQPAGFFRVVARAMVDYDTAIDSGTNEDAHQRAMQVLENTRTY